MKKLLGLAAAVGMLCLAPAIASASMIDFGFENHGTFGKTDCGTSLCDPFETSGNGTDVGLTTYVNTNGTGLFAGTWGDVSSVISISKWYSDLPEFHETRRMRHGPPPTAVAEPSVTGLATLGFAMLALAALRRRMADVTRS
ncbi:MAG TPA: hypothetical protein VG994_19960 [Steroidobacteraceae bacterium]|nr:hypothetical protein [Steroidobacteraceae bacterium]